MKKLSISKRSIFTAAVGIMLTQAAAASLLFDEFIAGDGSGITYTVGTLSTQQGGSGWAPDSAWGQGGRTLTANIASGNYISISASNPGQTQSAIRHVFREYQAPNIPISSMKIKTTIELTDLSGFSNILDPTAPVTTSGSSSASDYFSFSPRSSAGTVNTSALWYLEASAGSWHVLPGSTSSSNYGDPIALAPLVQGETYEIEVSFSGQNTWAVSILALGANETYNSGWLEYIGDNTDADLINWISYRTVVDQNTLSNPVEIRIHDLQIIPEPSTYALVLGSLVLLLIGLRRRQ